MWKSTCGHQRFSRRTYYVNNLYNIHVKPDNLALANLNVGASEIFELDPEPAELVTVEHLLVDALVSVIPLVLAVLDPVNT